MSGEVNSTVKLNLGEVKGYHDDTTDLYILILKNIQKIQKTLTSSDKIFKVRLKYVLNAYKSSQSDITKLASEIFPIQATNSV